jgi:glycosyltransferase involved in cell wall biosynthesis
MITVAIPTYNRPETLRSVFRTYLQSALVSEFILVDDGSDRDYASLRSEVSARCSELGVRFQYLRNERKSGAPASRNRALAASRNALLLFGEDDLYLGDGFIQALFDKAGDPRLRPRVVFGRLIYLDENGSPMRNDAPLMNRWSLAGNFSKLEADRFCEIGYSVALWDKHQTFDLGISYFENYPYNGYREETEPFIQLCERFGGDARILATGAATCYHLHHSRIEGGGQSRGSALLYEFFLFYNDFKFIFRHARYFIRSRGVIFFPLHVLALTRARARQLFMKIRRRWLP